MSSAHSHISSIPVDLLLRAAAGEQEAFTQIFHTHRDKVYTVALSITHNGSQAEELVQDVFLKLWLKREALANVKDFDAYLFIMTRNFALQALRKLALDRKAYAAFSENSLPLLTRDEEVEERQLQALVEEAVRMLPPRQAQAWRLLKEEGMKREAAAALLGISPNTLKEHLAQASRHIRAFVSARMDLPIWLLVLLEMFVIFSD